MASKLVSFEQTPTHGDSFVVVVVVTSNCLSIGLIGNWDAGVRRRRRRRKETITIVFCVCGWKRENLFYGGCCKSYARAIQKPKHCSHLSHPSPTRVSNSRDICAFDDTRKIKKRREEKLLYHYDTGK